MALAMMKLPMNRNTMGSANGVSTCLAVATLKSTASTAPSSAVTGIGTGSVTQ